MSSFGITKQTGSGSATIFPIGGTITGGLNNDILFIHPDGVLAQSGAFQYDTTLSLFTLTGNEYINSTGTDNTPGLSLFFNSRVGIPNADWNQVSVDFGVDHLFAAGDRTTQFSSFIAPGAYDAAGASSYFVGATLNIAGMPIFGPNITTNVTVGLAVGSIFNGDTPSSDEGYQFIATIPGIADGVGNVSRRSGLGFVAPGPVHLGNQTATLGTLASVIVGAFDTESTTNVRTIDKLTSLYVDGAPRLGTNVATNNGPWGVYISQADTFTEGRIIVQEYRAAQGSTAGYLVTNTNVCHYDDGGFISGIELASQETGVKWKPGAILWITFQVQTTLLNNVAPPSADFGLFALAGNEDADAQPFSVFGFKYEGNNTFREFSRSYTSTY